MISFQGNGKIKERKTEKVIKRKKQTFIIGGCVIFLTAIVVASMSGWIIIYIFKYTHIYYRLLEKLYL